MATKSDKSTKLVRIDQVKERYLKGVPIETIAQEIGVSRRTVYNIIAKIQNQYAKGALTNPQIAEKQYLEVQKLRDEVEIIKKEYWEIYAALKEEEKTNPEKSNTSKKLETLRSILQRVEGDAKLLGLFNPSTLIVNNYISVNDLKQILELVKAIIMELVPEEKRGYAFDKLRAINVTPTAGKDIIDVEVAQDRPKSSANSPRNEDNSNKVS